MKSSLLICRLCFPVFHQLSTNLLMRRCITGGRDLIAFSNPYQSMLVSQHVAKSQLFLPVGRFACRSRRSDVESIAYVIV
jgi:hypothetical protein